MPRWVASSARLLPNECNMLNTAGIHLESGDSTVLPREPKRPPSENQDVLLQAAQLSIDSLPNAEAEGFPQAQVTEDEIRMVTEAVVKTASVRAAGTLCPRCKKGKFVDGVCTNCRGSKLTDRPLPKSDSSEEMETVEPMSGRAGAGSTSRAPSPTHSRERTGTQASTMPVNMVRLWGVDPGDPRGRPTDPGSWARAFQPSPAVGLDAPPARSYSAGPF